MCTILYHTDFWDYLFWDSLLLLLCSALIIESRDSQITNVSVTTEPVILKASGSGTDVNNSSAVCMVPKVYSSIYIPTFSVHVRFEIFLDKAATKPKGVTKQPL